MVPNITYTYWVNQIYNWELPFDKASKSCVIEIRLAGLGKI